MRILRSDEVDIGQAQYVFRHSTRADGAAAAIALAVLLTTAVATWLGAMPAVVGVLAMAASAVFGLVAYRLYRKGTGPGNWLVAHCGTHILIKLRSHLNDDASGEPSMVVQLNGSDIDGIRIARSRTAGHDAAGTAASVRVDFLELSLRDESSQLAALIHAERTRRGVVVWRHYPVTMPDASTLRLEWRSRYSRVTPDIDAATALMADIAPTLQETSENIDLGSPGRPPATSDVASRLELLASQGRTLDAVTLAVRAYGISQTEARRMIDALPLRDQRAIERTDESREQ